MDLKQLPQDLYSKFVILRVDLNSPVKNGKIEISDRLKQHTNTIKYFMKKGVKLIVLAHQGRKQSSDFIGLEQHFNYIKSQISNISFCNSRDWGVIISHVKNIKPGSALLLENIRMINNEDRGKDSELVKNLDAYCDFFVLDAFSVAHRNQASITGFSHKAYAGPILEKEYNMLSKIKNIDKNLTIILAGSKPKDSFAIIDTFKHKQVNILTGGLFSVVLLAISGVDIGKPNLELINKKGLDLDANFNINEKIILPIDVALDIDSKRKEVEINSILDYPIKDIGSKTIEKYISIINNSDYVLINGPLGVYEQSNFEKGTRLCFNALANSTAFCVAGGGHTLSALKKFNVFDKIDYVSLSGKAMIWFLANKSLPGLEQLFTTNKHIL